MEDDVKNDQPLSAETVSALAGRVQQVLTEATAALASANELLERVQAARTEIEAQRLEIQARGADLDAALAEAARVREAIAGEQSEIAAKSANIQGALEHATSVRAQIDSSLQNATELQTKVAGLHADIQLAAASSAESATQAASAKEDVDTHLAAALQAAEAAKSAMATAKNLAARSDTIEQRVDAYEGKLSALQAQSHDQLLAIQELLPGATAAGLASAFDKRRQTFLQPARRWQWLFVGSLGALVALALSGLWHVYGAGITLTWDELARLWLARLPIAGALVWLALHASRESALAKRLEEDYGYKAAIAASFQGFQNQMADLSEDAKAGSPLGKLCEDTLSTIANPPGRIYDKHKLTVSPTDELHAVTKEALDRAKKQA
jgi:hypothetical protein